MTFSTIVFGDNLLALKALKSEFTCKIKCKGRAGSAILDGTESGTESLVFCTKTLDNSES